MTLGMHKDFSAKVKKCIGFSKGFFRVGGKSLVAIFYNLRLFEWPFSWRITLDIGNQYCFAFCFLILFLLAISPDPLGCHRSRYPQPEGWGPTVGCESSRSVDMLVLPGEEVSFPSPFRPISLVKKKTKRLFSMHLRSLFYMLTLSMIQSLELTVVGKVHELPTGRQILIPSSIEIKIFWLKPQHVVLATTLRTVNGHRVNT